MEVVKDLLIGILIGLLLVKLGLFLIHLKDKKRL